MGGLNGCGKETAETSADKIIYIPEYAEFPKEIKNVQLCSFKGDELFIMDSTRDEKSGTIASMAIDNQDNIYLYSQLFGEGESESIIVLLDQSGSVLGKITSPDWLTGMFSAKDGTVYIRSFGSGGVIDIQKKSFGTAITGISGPYGSKSYGAGFEKTIVGTDGDTAFTYDTQSAMREDLFNWLDLNVLSNNILYTGQLSDGRIWALLNHAVNNDYEEVTEAELELVFAGKANAKDVVPKEEIVYGAFTPDAAVKENIVKFNKSNDQYHVKLKDYLSVNEDLDASITMFNNDFVTGSAPDIIDISKIDYSKYANKGILEDLYGYMNRSGINKEDYLENIFKASESEDGKLLGISPQLVIMTATAKKSLVGDISGRTVQELIDFDRASLFRNNEVYADTNTVC